MELDNCAHQVGRNIRLYLDRFIEQADMNAAIWLTRSQYAPCSSGECDAAKKAFVFTSDA
ncbi:hypothetical protein A3739_26930 [Oleiphilus sp. HI0067]|nr:hypothetical protein A3738_11450 [Oleiphilus sp. HI0066]KZY67355.1 hypothetical protein A3739_01845 [Oleiphilus sp. HI0067]KZY73202.1 hypothetical protein A3739_26930 [Oleiphilus sp. HI0067]